MDDDVSLLLLVVDFMVVVVLWLVKEVVVVLVVEGYRRLWNKPILVTMDAKCRMYRFVSTRT